MPGARAHSGASTSTRTYRPAASSLLPSGLSVGSAGAGV